MITVLITELLKTGGVGEKPRVNQLPNWTMEWQVTFKEIKRLFAAEPVLKHPNPEEPFVIVIQADASDVAVGAVLLQKSKEGKLQPCTYMSQNLNEIVRQQAVWEKETFAVRCALLIWRQSLEGSKIPFEVWTDRKTLKVLRTLHKFFPNHVWWAQYFNQFDFELKYFLADTLSCMP